MASLHNYQLSPRVGYITCRPLDLGPFGHQKPPCPTAVLAVAAVFEGSDTVRRYGPHVRTQDRGLAAGEKRLRNDDFDSRIKQCECIRCSPPHSDLDLSIAIKNAGAVT